MIARRITIFVGICLMVMNILLFYRFIHQTNDILTGGRKAKYWKWLSEILLVCFLAGYLIIDFFGAPDWTVTLVLLGGSVFVAFVIQLMTLLVSQSRDNSIQISKALVDVMGMRDPNLNGHSLNVQNLCNLIYLHLPHSLQHNINQTSLSYAALMHDIGKMGIPESILNKPGKLTDEEWEIMKQHPKYGVELLQDIHTFNQIDDWIKYHHERIDGKGYYGLKNGEIPLASKIIAIADTYSAITMHRTYHPERTYEEAIKIIKDAAGTQLDAMLVNIFVSLPKQDVLECAPRTSDFEQQVLEREMRFKANKKQEEAKKVFHS